MQIEESACSQVWHSYKSVLKTNGNKYFVYFRSEQQMVAFNGGKYYIICRSLTMFIVVLCESRSKIEPAAAWLKRINARLIEKEY